MHLAILVLVFVTAQSSLAEPGVKPVPIVENCHENIYGCCPDGKTDAAGRRFKGCGVALCKDLMRGCVRIKQHCQVDPIEQYKIYNFMKDRCAKTCGMCKARAPLICQRSRFGCCWDKSPAWGPNKTPGKNCPVCHDKRSTLCKRFRSYCRSRAGPRARSFLRSNCHWSCGLC